MHAVREFANESTRHSSAGELRLVVGRSDSRAWLAQFFASSTSDAPHQIDLRWDSKDSGKVLWGGKSVASARIINGGTDSTEGPGESLRLFIDTGEASFGFAVAHDDGLAALDWTLHCLAARREPGHPALLECLKYGQERKADHSHLWRGRVFEMLELYASELVSIPGCSLKLSSDAGDAVSLTYQQNYVRLSPAEHDTAVVEYKGQTELFEFPVWVHGLESWADSFFTRLRSESLFLLRTKFLGLPLRRQYLFERDLPTLPAGWLLQQSSEVFLPAAQPAA